MTQELSGRPEYSPRLTEPGRCSRPTTTHSCQPSSPRTQARLAPRPGSWVAAILPVGIGVLGHVGEESGTWSGNSGFVPTGVSGDTGNLGGIGVWGTADSGYAIFGENNGPYVTGLFLNSSSSSSYALEAGTLTHQLPGRYWRRLNLHRKRIGRGTGTRQPRGSSVCGSVAG